MARREQRVLAAALVVALGLVAAVSAGGRSWSTTASGSGWATRIVALALVGAIGLAWFVLVVRGFRTIGTGFGPRLSAGWAAAIVAMGLVIGGLAVLWSLIGDEHPTCCFGRAPYVGRVGGEGTRAGGGGRLDDPTWGLHVAPAVWIGASVAVAAIVLGIAAIVVYRRRRRRPADGDEAVRAVAEVVAESLDDLRRERDARRAVIACYARMERTLSGLGVSRARFEAPFEYLERVLAGLRVPAPSVQRLTQLFEEAKFSRHVVNERMREDAIDALSTLRQDLKARAAATTEPRPYEPYLPSSTSA